MTTSRRARQQRDASTRADLDETILVWNGVVARTKRAGPRPLDSASMRGTVVPRICGTTGSAVQLRREMTIRVGPE
jgi:hypothetical protein